jgi:hypothetical protein
MVTCPRSVLSVSERAYGPLLSLEHIHAYIHANIYFNVTFIHYYIHLCKTHFSLLITKNLSLIRHYLPSFKMIFWLPTFNTKESFIPHYCGHIKCISPYLYFYKSIHYSKLCTVIKMHSTDLHLFCVSNYVHSYKIHFFIYFKRIPYPPLCT